MSATQPEQEMREQLIAVFETADYPLTSPYELIPTLPEGPSTTFEAGDVELGAMELGMEYAEYQDYPYTDVEELVDDLMTGLHDDALFE